MIQASDVFVHGIGSPSRRYLASDGSVVNNSALKKLHPSMAQGHR